MTTCVTKVKYIMHNVQDYSVVYNKVFRPVLCEGWHFTHIWKTLAWQHHFTKVEVWVHKTNLISPLLFIYVSIPSQKVNGHVFVCSGVDCILIQFKCPVHHNQQLCMYVCMYVCVWFFLNLITYLYEVHMRGLLLTRKRPDQVFLVAKLKSSFRKSYDDLVDRYESLTMTWLTVT